jgi:group II intron reverse transcriptase/maturase
MEAYRSIAKSQGSMTVGADGLTLDDMSMSRINRIIASLKDHSYQPNPARRVYIAKQNNPNKKRPLGIPSTDDKLVQEVVRMILEAIYEPGFSNNSHGFRPNRSCHTALENIGVLFTGAKWVVEGDIKACFDSFDHHVLIDILRRRIHDEHFIGLMWKFLKAGYMEQWEYHSTFSGTPQGGLCRARHKEPYVELDVTPS